jgi:fatty acid amide hydrolase 2
MSATHRQASATTIARQVRAGLWSARAVVESHLDELQRVNPTLNALTRPAADEARRHADEIDQRVRAGGGAELPLAGVPFVVSEALAVEGMPHTAGVLHRADQVATRSATVVQRWMDAGAILLGMANTSELGFGGDTTNLLHGTTRNPWDPRRSAGGGAGGVAALVASSCAAFGAHPDAWGSTVMAGAHCGVMTWKVTGGRLPTTGTWPAPRGRARRYTTVGLSLRDARDAWLVGRVASGPDGEDQSALQTPLADPEGVDWVWKRVLICDRLGPLQGPPRREVRRALDRAARILRDHGAEIEQWRSQQFSAAADIWLALLHESHGLVDAWSDHLQAEGRTSLSREWARVLAGNGRHVPSSLAMATLERFTRGSYARIQRLAAEGRRLRDRIHALLDGGGVLLLPAWPHPMLPTRRLWTDPRAMLYGAIFHVLELPTVTVPMQIPRSRFPVGVQIVGALDHDHEPLAAALAMQQAQGRRAAGTAAAEAES